MTTLEIVLICTNVWTLGAFAIIAIEEAKSWAIAERIALAAWPLWVPFALTVRTYRRWRYTCRDCGRRSGDKKHHLIHLEHRNGCPGTPIPNPDNNAD